VKLALNRTKVVDVVMIVAALVLATLAMAASSCQRPIPPPVPPTQVDAGAPMDGEATCTTACENIFALGCPDKPSRCIEACENVQASGVFAYDVSCITRAKDCAAVSACH